MRLIGAVEAGVIDLPHFGNYRKLTEESDFNQLTYADRRKKYRDFGRFIKSARKSIKSLD